MKVFPKHDITICVTFDSLTRWISTFVKLLHRMQRIVGSQCYVWPNAVPPQ